MIGGAALTILSACSSGSESSNSGFTSLSQPTMNPTAASSDTTDAATGEPATTTGTTTSTTTSPTSGDSSSTGSDDPSTSGDGSSSTAPPGGCGNGMPDPLEPCDDGNDIDTDECTNACTVAACGDGIIHEGVETCDDMGESPTCDADCSAVMCGDMVVNAAAGEACDDGGESAACDADCSAAMCGDMVVNAAAGEVCDDGNQVNGDGCEDDCTKTVLLPPECLNPVLLSDAFRNVNNIGGQSGCDNPMATQWYRFTGAAGVKMPTQAPPTSRCGTDAPGWLSGGEPQVNDGAVARTVCFHWNGNICNWSEPVTVRNCGDYFVYYLKNVSWGCSGRYCGTN